MVYGMSNKRDHQKSKDAGDDWLHAMEKLSDTDDYRGSRKAFNWYYNELSKAFNNSKQKECLEEEFKLLINKFMVQARGTAAVPSSHVGQIILMLPPYSRKRKTHSVTHSVSY
jgi:hypothetical protein